jgi:hypothetical protein
MVGRSTARKVGRKGAGAAAGLVKTLSDPKKTRRLITVSKLIAPVMAPAALKAAEGLRYFADQQRARKLGVNVDAVAAYRGPTGRTKARIDALGLAVRELRDRRTGDPGIITFTDHADKTLADLTTAANAAGPMPPARRRPTVAAIARELDQLEAELITHLVRAGV